MADLHIGGWADPKMKEVNMETFRRAIAICMEEHVDFILFAGDVFNTAIPQIDLIKEATAILRTLKEACIPVYVIPGSHDFSPSGKTMLDVLENAGLLINVMRFADGDLQFTINQKTGAKITGLLGRKGGLDRIDYQNLRKEPLEKEEGFKIFMFHTALEEFKPAGLEDMEAQSVAALPKNFQYYAGGHVHYIYKAQYGGGILTYPGALYPNNFKELEEYHRGGFFIVDGHLNMKRIDIPVVDVASFSFDGTGKTAFQLQEDMELKLSQASISGKIVLLRLTGTLRSGKPSDIDFKRVYSLLSSAYFVMKNSNFLQSQEMEGVKVETGTIEEVEAKVVEAADSGISLFSQEKEFIVALMSVLDKEKAEGEKVADFERRVLDDAFKVVSF